MEILIEYVFNDGRRQSEKIVIGDRLCLARNAVPAGVNFIEVRMADFTAGAGEDGYLLVQNARDRGRTSVNDSSALIMFKDRPDMEFEFAENTMPVFAVKKGGRAILAVVAGMAQEYALVAGVENEHYYLYPRFELNGRAPYEDIEIRFFRLEGLEADYSGMARCYRRYQLERGACLPLRERAKSYPVLAEAARGPEIRVRMGWKPVPPPVLEQTEENEPPMHAAITFERGMDIVNEFRRYGIEHAEFCLVGWNKSGHDGRFPDIFPVEPLLGGEEKLKELIRHARANGYLICGHTNLLDSYTVAKRWKWENMLRDESGELHKGGRWGGGQSYYLCPQMAHQQYAGEDFEQMAELGFHGTHYLDVMSIVRPDACYDPNHPLNRREAGEWRSRTLALAREKIGASGSEGGWDFCCGSLDYVMYSIFNPNHELPAICDKTIPFWHLVYHGIMLYNTSCATVNSSINPDRRARLKNLEYGGRPLSYFYAKFLSSGRNWMGEFDCSCATDAELLNCVAKIKEEYDEYRKVCHLQFEFMESHEEIMKDVVKVSYANGETLIFNYSSETVRYAGLEIPVLGFKIVPSKQNINYQGGRTHVVAAS